MVVIRIWSDCFPCSFSLNVVEVVVEVVVSVVVVSVVEVVVIVVEEVVVVVVVVLVVVVVRRYSKPVPAERFSANVVPK